MADWQHAAHRSSNPGPHLSTRDTANARRTTDPADYGECLPSLGQSYSFACCGRSLPSTPLPGLCFSIRLENAALDHNRCKDALGITMAASAIASMQEQKSKTKKPPVRLDIAWIGLTCTAYSSPNWNSIATS